MKVQIRRGLFETNSSSVHTLVIGNNGQNIYKDLPKEIKFELEFVDYYSPDTVQKKANFLYRQIVVFSNNTSEDLNKIKNYLQEFNIKCIFTNPLEYSFFRDVIDERYNVPDFVNDILEDSVSFMNYLFSEDSYIGLYDNNLWEEQVVKPKNLIKFNIEDE